jgi:hypothetical protein
VPDHGASRSRRRRERRPHITRSARQRVRRLERLRVAVHAQIEQERAPLRPHLHQLARKALPVAAAPEQPVQKHRPAFGLRILRHDLGSSEIHGAQCSGADACRP